METFLQILILAALAGSVFPLFTPIQIDDIPFNEE